MTLSIALIGGRQSIRRDLATSLKRELGLKKVTEIPAISEKRVTKKKLQCQLKKCDLICIITAYVDHSINDMVLKLKRSQRIEGDVFLISSCQGKTGCFREILKHTNMNFC